MRTSASDSLATWIPSSTRPQSDSLSIQLILPKAPLMVPKLASPSLTGEEEDWVQVYKESFPPEEMADVDTLKQGIIAGERQLHRTLDDKGQLLCFSLIYTGFEDIVWLSYIATSPTNRSKGIGSEHLTALLRRVESEFCGRTALVLEIESPDVPGLDAEQVDTRKRRLDFYCRQNVRRMTNDKHYRMPSFVDGVDAMPAELLWFELAGATKELNMADLIPQIYSKIYGLSSNHALVLDVMTQFKSR